MSPSSPGRRPARLVVVEDHALLGESIELALTASGYAVAHLAPGPPPLADTISAVTRLRPDIALVDIDPGRYGDGLRLVAPLSRNRITVVAMTSSPVRDRWGEAVRYGAAKVLSRARPLADVLTTVRRILADLPVMSEEERTRLVELGRRRQLEQRDVRARLESLTTREAEVLGELIEGRPVREIATGWGVSESTVRTQVKAILTKLDVSSQVGAVGRAHEVGWRPPPR